MAADEIKTDDQRGFKISSLNNKYIKQIKITFNE